MRARHREQELVASFVFALLSLLFCYASLLLCFTFALLSGSDEPPVGGLVVW
jgi:hypothetical protein